MTSLLYATDGRVYRVIDLLRLLLHGKLERRKRQAQTQTIDPMTVMQYRVVAEIGYEEFCAYLEEYALLRDSIKRLGGAVGGIDREHGANEYMSLIQQADALTSEK